MLAFLGRLATVKRASNKKTAEEHKRELLQGEGAERMSNTQEC